MWSDPIADMLTRVRNAVRAKKQSLTMPFSKIKQGIAQVLKDEGYITDHDVIDVGVKRVLRLQLKYGPRGEEIIHGLQRISRGGCRVYSGFSDLPSVLDGLGINVVSTSRGVLSDRTCRELKVGGEVLCKVY